MKQIGLGLHNYLSTFRVFPPGGTWPHPINSLGAVGGPFSPQARILPYLEQENLVNLIDFSKPYGDQATVSKNRIASYICPSEIEDHLTTNGNHWPFTYAANSGDWLIWDAATQTYGTGAFGENSRIAPQDLPDGMSNTILFAEVKMFQPFIRPTADPSPLTIPANVAALALPSGQAARLNAHTEWVEGRSPQYNFTTTFTPNAKVPYTDSTGTTYDSMDYVSRTEVGTVVSPSATDARTYGAITARSYHPSLVHILLGDGSVRGTSDNINQGTWRALGTRAGGEVTGDF